MPKEISRKIGILNIIYTIAIVLYHFNLESAVTGRVVYDSLGEKVAFFLNGWMTNAGTYAVSFFYMTSAFLLYYNLTKDNWREKLKRRLFSLLVPYLLWNTIYMLLFSHTRVIKRDYVQILSGYANSEYCGPLWFVEGLLFMLLFIPLLASLVRVPFVSEGIVILAFACNAMGWSFVKGNGFVDFMGIFRYLYYVPSYLLGVYLAVRMRPYVFQNKYSKWIRIMALVAYGLAFIDMKNASVEMLLNILHPISLWIIFPTEKCKMESKVLVHNTFMIYAMHDAGYQSFRRIFSYFHLAWYGRVDWSEVSIVYLWGYRILMGSIVLGLCVFFSLLCQRLFPKMYRMLSGGR